MKQSALVLLALALVAVPVLQGLPAEGQPIGPSAEESACTLAIVSPLNEDCAAWVSHRHAATGTDSDDSYRLDAETSPVGGTLFVLEAFDGDVEAGEEWTDVSSPPEGLEFRTIAYDTETGQRLWTASYDAELGPSRPAGLEISPEGARVYVAGDAWTDIFAPANRAYRDIATIAYDAETGQEEWRRFAAGAPSPGQPNVPSDDTAVDLTVGPNDRVFVTGLADAPPENAEDHLTVAYDGSTGDLLWRHRYDGNEGEELNSDLDEPAAIDVDPDGERVYVTGSRETSELSLDNAVTYALDAATGERLWEQRVEHWPRDWGIDVVASEQAVYTYGGVDTRGGEANATAYLISRDALTGETLWDLGLATPTKYRAARDVMLVDEQADRVYLMKGLPAANPAVGPGWIRDMDISALEASTGQRLWVTNFGRSPTDVPAAQVDPVEIALSPDGSRLYGFGLATRGQGLWTGAHDAGTGEAAWASAYGNHSRYLLPASIAVDPVDGVVLVDGAVGSDVEPIEPVTLAYPATGPSSSLGEARS